MLIDVVNVYPVVRTKKQPMLLLTTVYNQIISGSDNSAPNATL